MSTRILIAKYIDDFRRWEPRNIGVIVVSDGIEARFVGERDDGRIDGRVARPYVGDTDIYQEWVKYWRRVLKEGPSGIKEALLRSTDNYWLTETGEVWVGDESASVMARRYFDELIGRVSEPESETASLRLKPAVERLLEEAGIASDPSFTRDKRVQAMGKPNVSYRFQYYWENGRKVVGQRVPLSLPVYVHDALWKFTKIPNEFGIVAFVSTEEASDGTWSELQSEAPQGTQVVDVDDKKAVDRVKQAFH